MMNLIRLKARQAARSVPVDTVRTGEHCPRTGWWVPNGAPEAVKQITEGSIMPTSQGRPAVWVADLSGTSHEHRTR